MISEDSIKTMSHNVARAKAARCLLGLWQNREDWRLSSAAPLTGMFDYAISLKEWPDIKDIDTGAFDAAVEQIAQRLMPQVEVGVRAQSPSSVGASTARANVFLNATNDGTLP